MRGATPPSANGRWMNSRLRAGARACKSAAVCLCFDCVFMLLSVRVVVCSVCLCARGMHGIAYYSVLAWKSVCS